MGLHCIWGDTDVDRTLVVHVSAMLSPQSFRVQAT